MAKALIEAQFTPAAFNYDWKGRGRDSLVIDLTRCMHSSTAYIVLTDVADCYDTIRFSAIYDLNLLPEAFVRANMDGTNLRFVKERCRHKDDNNRASGPTICPLCTSSTETVVWSGLVQGSPASSSLLAVLINDLADHIPAGVKPFTFADNIALVCETEEEARAARDALACYMSRHPAGPLALRTDFFGPATRGFEFLGYSIDRGENGWEISIASKTLYRIVERVHRARVAEGAMLTVDEAFTTACAGFPALTREGTTRMLALVEDTLCGFPG